MVFFFDWRERGGGSVDARVDVNPLIGEEVGVDVEADLAGQAEESGLAHR